MDRFHQSLVLDLLPQLGVYRLNERLNNLDPFELFNCTGQQLSELGFNHEQISMLQNPPEGKLSEAKSWVFAQENRSVISYFDDQYPALLKEISSPPMLLFCEGRHELLHVPQISMVGSRVATISGKETAKRLAGELVELNFCITSGLAAGIDSYAHRGALDRKGQTIAVMGCGLNTIYPKSNITLANEIRNQGLLISEFWPNVAPSAPNFPRRNRIVSGLSLGVVVIEAAEKSGSLITARLAAQQNREVFAVPGSINNPKVAGCHKLISQGAKLITNVADILEEFPQYSIINKEVSTKHLSVPNALNSAELDPVLNSIGYETTPVDIIVQRTQLSIEQVLEQLLNLELAGLIVSSPGGFIRLQEGA